MKNFDVRRTIDAYDKNARKYIDKFDNYEIYVNKITDFQKKFITGGASILDLGCGPGNNIKTLTGLDNTCSFTGVDLSDTFIQIAKERFPEYKFLQQDIRHLSLDLTYDVILASFCIVHLKHKETAQFFTSLADLCKPDGHLYLSYMNGTKSGFEVTSFSQDEIFFNYYDDQFIIDQLVKNGMKILEISKEDYRESDGSITTDTFIYAQKENQ